ncbi:MAG: DUF2029 domain-containing protein, partial [Candidatus Eremiobacteraeota bacterium]|nr:DUF2029 domain-containing protein [Candidatus Eremiobacteraeota bacterium]
MNWLRPRQAAVTWVAGILLAACALFMTELSRSSGHLAAIRGAAYIGLTIAGVWGSVLLWNRNDRNALLVMIAAAVLARAALLPATPSLSHDAFRYMWDGRLLRHGVDPYVAPPNDPSLHAFRNDWLYAYIDWNTVPTLYPPVDLALFALADILDDKNTLAIKLLVEVGDLATLSLLIILLRRRNLPIGRAAVYAWSPLVITELAYSGHEEAWCLAALLLAISLTERTRTRLGACVLAVAALVKLYPIALYPAFFPRKSAQPYAIGAALIVAAYAPFY